MEAPIVQINLTNSFHTGKYPKVHPLQFILSTNTNYNNIVTLSTNITCEKLNCGSHVPQRTFEQLMSSHQNIREVMYRLRVAESRLWVQPFNSRQPQGKLLTRLPNNHLFTHSPTFQLLLQPFRAGFSTAN